MVCPGWWRKIPYCWIEDNAIMTLGIIYFKIKILIPVSGEDYGISTAG